ncbi:hypothetical protein HNP87_001433 [Methanococcus maripaludis]|uniref:PEGA domain-containing protein n=1 Tax=Methanococcus maripaludis TaxID=39152 RepID=A0A7J9NJX3_METMI|nr:hypothetical protein [Methanococcus maripaludis]
MIKRYFLFLVLLMCVVGSVNALTCTVPETCTETDYYVILNDDTLTDTLLISQLESITTWENCAPTVSGISGNIIYFPDESNLARFCSLISYNSGIMFNGDFLGYISGQQVPITTIYYYFYSGQSSGYNYATLDCDLGSATTAYFLVSSHCGSSDGTSIDVNGARVFSGNQDGPTSAYISTVFSSDTLLQFGDGVGYSTAPFLAGSIVVFEYMDSEKILNPSYLTINYTLEPPDLINIGIYSLADVAIYENDYLIGTTDNGGYTTLPFQIGDHTLTFVKEGYWDTLKTISVSLENEPELFVSLAPKTAIFQVSNEFSGNLYPNSVGTLSMDITPLKEAYASKLRVSGIEVNKVYYQTLEVPRSADGYYILGDVTSTQNIEIEFKTPSSWGEKTFTVELSATDIEGTAYNNLETIDYEVLELPFLLEMPETFGIGINDITLTDQSGTAYSVLMVLYDSDDVEVWSSSTNLLEYCDYTFDVPIDDAGDYTLELNAKAGTVKTYYSIDIIEPVTLITEEINVNPGKIATVQFKISNPTSNVKYYTAELTCPFYNESIAKTFSIAPETVDKTVDISFEVPKGLELENYQLSLEIFDPDKTDAIYSGNVVLTISSSSLFLASVPGGNTTIILLAAAVLLIAGTFAALRLKK